MVYHGTGAFGANALSGLTITFQSLTPEICTVTGSGQGASVYGVAAGNCTLTADQAGDKDYNAAPQFAKTFAIKKADQKIVFTPIANRSLSLSPFAVSATASSGLPVSFSSLTGGVCKLAGNMVSLLKSGTCIIRAEQPTGDANYNPASKVNQSFIVTNAVTTSTTTSLSSTANPSTMGQTISFTATVTAANGATPTGTVSFAEAVTALAGCSKLALTGNDNIKTAVCTINTLTLGTHRIIASYSGDEANEASASLPLDQRIKPLEHYALVVTNSGQGTVASQPGGIDCGTTCTANFVGNTLVTLTPQADKDRVFLGWSGVCNGKGGTCQVSLDQSKSVTARFGKTRRDTLAIDFGINGIWLRQSSGVWRQLKAATAEKLIAADLDGNGVFDLSVDFSNPPGIYAWMNQQGWVKLHDESTHSVTAADINGNGTGDLVIRFDLDSGLWGRLDNWDWVKLHDLSPAAVTAAYLDENVLQDLLIDFGPDGLWQWMNNQAWIKLEGVQSPSATVAADLDGNGHEDLVFSFGNNGLWALMNHQVWVQLDKASVNAITPADLDGNGMTDLVVVFDNTDGLWAWMNHQGWVKLHDQSPASITAAYLDDNALQDLVIDFSPNGLWLWMNTHEWKMLHVSPARHIITIPE